MVCSSIKGDVYKISLIEFEKTIISLRRVKEVFRDLALICVAKSKVTTNLTHKTLSTFMKLDKEDIKNEKVENVDVVRMKNKVLEISND